MNENQRIAVMAASLLLVLGAVGYFWLWPRFWPATSDSLVPETVTPAPAPQTPALPASNAAEPAPEPHPLPAAATEPITLPPLADSDTPFAAALGALMDPVQMAGLLVSEQRIRRLVATVDNLPRERLAMNDRAFRRVPGELMVRSADGSYSLNPGNEARYQAAVAAVLQMGAEPAAALYLRYYPLFNAAYRDLGRPGIEFNDRLIQVIDHLLAAPAAEAPIALVQPKVFYQFADPALEARSAGQKIMIRMGTVNQAQLKAWLRTFRAAIIGGSDVS